MPSRAAIGHIRPPGQVGGGLRGPAGLGDRDQVVLARDQLADAVANRRVVVDQHDMDRQAGGAARRWGSGALVLMARPGPGGSRSG